MSDVNMGKIRELYADMVAIEYNVAAIERKIIENLAVLERRTAQRSTVLSRSPSQSPATTLKTLLMVGSTAFGAGLSLVFIPVSGISWLAGIPVGMASTWFLIDYFEKNDRRAAQTKRSQVPEIKHRWTEGEFTKAAAATHPKLSERILKACWSVLIHGDDLLVTAQEFKVWSSTLLRALELLERNKRRD